MDGDGWMDRFRRFQVRTRRRRECAAQLPARTPHLAQRQRPSIIGDTNGRVPRLHTLAGVVEVVAARCAGPGCSPLRLPVQDWQKPPTVKSSPGRFIGHLYSYTPSSVVTEQENCSLSTAIAFASFGRTVGVAMFRLHENELEKLWARVGKIGAACDSYHYSKQHWSTMLIQYIALGARCCCPNNS